MERQDRQGRTSYSLSESPRFQVEGAGVFCQISSLKTFRAKNFGDSGSGIGKVQTCTAASCSCDLSSAMVLTYADIHKFGATRFPHPLLMALAGRGF